MKTKQLFKFVSIIMLVFFLQACQAADEKTTEKSEPKVEEPQSYTVTDDLGNEVTFDEVPETVISLQPSNTEILFELGVGEKIIGVTDYDHYPEEASKIERVSDSVNINAEKILSLKPDVVIAYTVGEQEALKPITDAGIPVFVIQSASSFEDVYGDIEQLADVMGVAEVGEEVVEEIQANMKEVEEKLSGVTTKMPLYLEISPSPDIYTTGMKTFQQEIVDRAGVENVFGDQEGWIKVAEEEVISRNPELIVTTVNYVENAVAEIKGRSGWDQIKAIQNDQVFLLDADVLSRPGPRIDDAVELLAKTAYPELFQ
ncbi:ABC transporter substrate-binding protein [Cytobacillus spongiae]|uniref:ABC transporter substrate-binding protein n=1 Tax=Cytobacillus spongiae TaxID=2901381 RepID=UPI001F2227D1|nr:ABC transporter substrate-binding protein [Cytobacillus spongiae]UII57882.1 ABC transporter substrate-binding protein [Cytobacillus spongiae]